MLRMTWKVYVCPKRMRSPGINGEGELRGQLANPSSPGKMAIKRTVCVCVCVCVCVEISSVDQARVRSMQCLWCCLGLFLKEKSGRKPALKHCRVFHCSRDATCRQIPKRSYCRLITSRARRCRGMTLFDHIFVRSTYSKQQHPFNSLYPRQLG